MESDDQNYLSGENYRSTKQHHLPVTPHAPPLSVKPRPPSKHKKRPQTAGDFRSRRYRQRSVEEPVQFMDTLHHDVDNDRKKLDSRQPDHLTDINGQYQDTGFLKDTASSGCDPEQAEKKSSKK